MAENSRLAEIRKKFQSNNAGFVPTPESQFGRLKKSKEDQQRAIKVAKARAARYNMTLRALAIKTTQDTTKMQRNDMNTKKEAANMQASYKATSRAISINAKAGRRMTVKDQQNISKALNDDVSPTVAKDLLFAAAKKRHNDDVKATRMQRKTEIKAAKKEIPPPIENEDDDDVLTEEDEPEVKKSEKKAAPEPTKKAVQKIEMAGVGEALASGNEDMLNKSILANFLEASAPHLLDKQDELLDKYKEQLHVLFGKLLNQYPDGQDAAISGRQKADKEIADAVEKGDVKVQAAKPKEKVKSVKIETPPEPEPVDDDDDSMVMNEDDIDVFEGKEVPEKKKTNIFDEEIEDDDDASFIVEDDQDEEYKKGYEKTIEEAEKDPKVAAMKSLARRRSTVKIDAELQNEINTTYAAPRSESMASFKSINSDNSFVVTPEGPIDEGGYIVAADLEEDEKQETSRWAVQFQNKNEALKKKLLKQGLSPEQVEDLVNDLDKNTSEML